VSVESFRIQGDPYSVATRFVKDNQDDLFDLVGAVGGVANIPNMEEAFSKAGSALSVPGMLTGVGEMANKVEECVITFMEDTSLQEKERALRGTIVSFSDYVYTALSCRQFLREAQGLSGEDGVGLVQDSLNIFSAVSGIVDNAIELAEIGEVDREEHTEYENGTNALMQQKNIWEIVKSSASIIGSVLGIAGVVAGLVISSWITLAVACVVFIGSIAAFWVNDALERHHQDHEIERIVTILGNK